MSVMDTDKDAIEEERRLAYVGITRAKEELTITYSKTRMNRGEFQHNPVSRFIREIPQELFDNTMPKHKSIDVDHVASTQKAKVTNAAVSFLSLSKGMKKAESLDYESGDRVSHIKYGTGTVVSIEEDVKDFKVTVDFDTAGRKIMYAMFAKLKKV